MRNSRRILLGLSASLLLWHPAGAVTPRSTNSGYENIPQRNVFGLKSPAPAPGAVQEPAPPTKILLTGITTILGNKLALLKALLPAGKPGEQPKEQPLMLTEGQRDGNIEVLQINERAGSVRVNNAGTLMTLTFEKDGPKLPALPAPQVPGALPTPANPYAPAGSGGLNIRTRVLPSLTPRRPATGALPAPVTGAATATTNAVENLPIPTPTGRASGYATAVPPEGQAQLTPEEQNTLLEIERQANSGGAVFYPPPPTTTTGNGTVQTAQPEALPGGLPPGLNLQRVRPPFLPQ